MRAEINRAHTGVRSQPTDGVQYNAFDPELQLWVAACLYKGIEDLYTLFYGLDPATLESVIYPYCKRLGTTLQVTDEMWPPDREAFEQYWQAGLGRIEMDDLTRGYLQGIASLSFVVGPLGTLGKPLARLLRPAGRLITLGFLPEPFRELLELPWDDRRQRRFDALLSTAVAINRRLPRPLREFPMNVYLWDTRRRIRTGQPIV
jgi:uncharacterized protein (DUF2236 family)